MGRSKAPTPPDPKETASAQTSTNIGTAIANNMMGMVNQYSPDGSLTHERTGSYTYRDPYTGRSHVFPTYTSTLSLSDAQKAIKSQTDAAELNLAETANQQSDFLKDYLGTPFSADTDEIEGRLEELGRKRLDPLMGQRRDAMTTRLANQGIAPGSEAYNREMALLGQQENDAYNQMFLQGRGQAFSELQALRNQPINEITALLSGSQVSNPQVSMYQPQGAATTDVAGLINQNYNQRLNKYQQDMASRNSILGGLFGLGAKAITGGLF
ncbi:MAG: hypothetical protein LPL29_12540 [Alphaproteobacteria bacterium]|nr:hypothetical protein [Alphaproteobacteria bacterium]MDX5416442.1 hypothetical protein [Alphaproteobacteria bacterium]